MSSPTPGPGPGPSSAPSNTDASVPSTPRAEGEGDAPPSPFTPPPKAVLQSIGKSLDVTALQEQVAALQAELKAKNDKIAAWEQCMTELFHSVMLSPEMNEIYKGECTELVRQALASVEQITDVHYVDCSFPSVQAEAPRIQLEEWVSLQNSEWSLKWSPPWSMQVSLEGTQFVQFNVHIRMNDFKVRGRLRVRANNDLSSIGLSFVTLPRFRISTECSVKWGSLPLPLQTYIESVVHQEFTRWLNDEMVVPHEVVINPPGFQPKQGLTDDDLKAAQAAAMVAKSYAAAHES